MCCPALLRAYGNHSGEAEHDSGIGLKLFGFIPEPVFTFIPESCSGSSRNAVRNHPGIAFTLARIPHTQGFVYQLYKNGTIDNLNNLLYCDEAVPNATSSDVLLCQIPQVHLFFTDTGTTYRKVVTLTVGGNDLLSLLKPDGTID